MNYLQQRTKPSSWTARDETILCRASQAKFYTLSNWLITAHHSKGFTQGCKDITQAEHQPRRSSQALDTQAGLHSIQGDLVSIIAVSAPDAPCFLQLNQHNSTKKQMLLAS
jgi:hypothetical protein